MHGSRPSTARAPALVTCLLLLAGCANGQSPEPPQARPPTVVAVEPAAPALGAQDAVPAELIEQLRIDLRKRLGLSSDVRPEVVEATAVTWPDGSLGCARPGVMYTMALVPGYRVVFRAAGGLRHYSAARSGGFGYCETPLAPGLPSSDR